MLQQRVVLHQLPKDGSMQQQLGDGQVVQFEEAAYALSGGERCCVISVFGRWQSTCYDCTMLRGSSSFVCSSAVMRDGWAAERGAAPAAKRRQHAAAAGRRIGCAF
jgi:hypothetical protein